MVAFPTDTLYGLGADAFEVEAVQRVFQIKGRTGDMALPLLLASIRDLEQVCTQVPDMAWPLVERFWPGPLTLIMRKAPEVPSAVTGGEDTVAVRLPDHPVPQALVRELGRPITGTSANPSGGPDPRTAKDVARMLGDRVDYILDGGPATRGGPSTILDLTKPNPRLVRQGTISLSALQDVCPVPLEVP